MSYKIKNKCQNYADDSVELGLVSYLSWS